MAKKQNVLDFTVKEPLVERLRRLWAHAEAIEIAQQMGSPLPNEVSEWLHRALKNIACGMDANEAFNVLPEKRGVRKDVFLSELNIKIANGYIAAKKEVPKGSKSRSNAQAINEISQVLPKTKPSTVRKNWNRLSTERKPTFTIGKK